MARPAPEIIKTMVTDTGTQIELLTAENCYVIVYKQQPVSIRTLPAGLGPLRRKYMKLSYASEGNARAQARRLNKLFDCLDFDYAQTLNVNQI